MENRNVKNYLLRVASMRAELALHAIGLTPTPQTERASC